MANNKVVCCILRDAYAIDRVLKNFERHGYDISRSGAYAKTSMIKIQFFSDENTIARHVDAIFDELWHYAGASDAILERAKNKLRDVHCLIKIYRE